MTQLIVDIGGTYMRLVLSDDGKTFRHDPQKIKTASFPSLETALQSFVESQNTLLDSIHRVAIAKSGRNAWVVDSKSLCTVFPVATLDVVNDFAANAMGLVNVRPDDLVHLGGAKTIPDESLPRAVIGSGTGLGLAYISPHKMIQETHGGHIIPAINSREQLELFENLQYYKPKNKVGTIAIYEDALSGECLLNIYKILCSRGHLDCEYSDTHHMIEAGRNNPLVQQTLRLYHEILGQFAHQVLAFGWAYGGLYLTGGITDRLMHHNLFDRDVFFKGLYQKNVPVVLNDAQSTPVFWVKDEFISLRGLLGSSAH